jgi:Polyketide cyclase / dehydrase and lipid transport
VSRVSREFTCTPDAVFDVLQDGWLYPTWVVGASRMRDVDNQWPRVGTELHHSVGSWPLLINDTTSSVEYSPPRRLALHARAWPTGEADILIEITPTPAGCTVTMTEDAVSGPGRLVPRPFRSVLLAPRNRESLRRLAFIAEGRVTPN